MQDTDQLTIAGGSLSFTVGKEQRQNNDFFCTILSSEQGPHTYSTRLLEDCTNLGKLFTACGINWQAWMPLISPRKHGHVLVIISLILYIFLWISSMQDGKNLANRNYNFVSSCHTLVKFISKTPFFFSRRERYRRIISYITRQNSIFSE
jgi:hypothetical protein